MGLTDRRGYRGPVTIIRPLSGTPFDIVVAGGKAELFFGQIGPEETFDIEQCFAVSAALDPGGGMWSDVVPEERRRGYRADAVGRETTVYDGDHVVARFPVQKGGWDVLASGLLKAARALEEGEVRRARRRRG